MTKKPLILLTNDDGVHSPGLRRLAEALAPLGDLLVAAPWEQQSSTGRSMRQDSTRIIHPCAMSLNGHHLEAYGIEGTPAQSVQHGILELAPRKPDLVVSGINYGENMGMTITISGTVMAAYEGAAWGIPAIAVSAQMEIEEMIALSEETDIGAAAFFAQKFASLVLAHSFPEDVNILKVDVPVGATPETPWRMTSLSRQSYYVVKQPEHRDFSKPFQLEWEMAYDPDILEPDSDIYALRVAREVSVTPLSLDFSARVNLPELEKKLKTADA